MTFRGVFVIVVVCVFLPFCRWYLACLWDVWWSLMLLSFLFFSGSLPFHRRWRSRRQTLFSFFSIPRTRWFLVPQVFVPLFSASFNSNWSQDCFPISWLLWAQGTCSISSHPITVNNKGLEERLPISIQRRQRHNKRAIFRAWVSARDAIWYRNSKHGLYRSFSYIHMYQVVGTQAKRRDGEGAKYRWSSQRYLPETATHKIEAHAKD